MSVIAAALKHMLAANMPHDAILRAVEDMEAGLQKDEQAERRRESDRERKRAKRLRNSADSTDKTDALRGGDARVEVKTSNLDIEPVEKKETPRAALEAVLDEARADAVIEHRQRLRKPLTAHAAKLLAGKFAQCPDPNAAADKMIGNGWQGFEPEWMNRPDARGSPPSKPLNASEILKARRQVNPDDDRPPNRPVLIASR